MRKQAMHVVLIPDSGTLLQLHRELRNRNDGEVLGVQLHRLVGDGPVHQALRGRAQPVEDAERQRAEAVEDRATIGFRCHDGAKDRGLSRRGRYEAERAAFVRERVAQDRAFRSAERQPLRDQVAGCRHNFGEL